MKHEEALNRAYRTFTGDEDEALLRLAKLKERADYRAYFAENIGKVKAAHSRHGFHEEMLRRFGILPSSYAGRPFEEWASFFDPLTDARKAPAEVRQYILPYLFYWPGVREVVSLTPPEEAVTVLEGKGECPRSVEDAECEPYERLYKIDLRKKTAQLIQEFKAALASVDASRGINPAAYTAWKQDRSRKREEEWTHLEAWRLRRQVPKPSFQEIAKRLRITPAAAKKSFYRAYELIYGKPFDLEAWRKDRAENPFKTCANCPQREGCTEPCPEIFEEKTSTRESIPKDAELNDIPEGREISRADAYAYNEWLTREEENE